MAGLDLTALLDENAGADARERAYAELLRLVTIFVRVKMGDRLRDHRESADVCQSIAKSFVDDAARGMLRFENQGALHGYLQQVVRSKLAELARHDGAVKRATPAGGGVVDAEAAEADDPSASIRALSKEELERVMAGLTAEEGQLITLRHRGLEWRDIALTLGVSEASLRQKWSRLFKALRS